jgi:hypothetical protein
MRGMDVSHLETLFVKVVLFLRTGLSFQLVYSCYYFASANIYPLNTYDKFPACFRPKKVEEKIHLGHADV